jgi:hypothetical protein
MAEAFGVTANVAGVVSLGLTVCQGLLNSYSVWKDAPDDVERMRESIKALKCIHHEREIWLWHPRHSAAEPWVV